MSAPQPWSVAAAAVLGSDHARRATDCQDSFCVRQDTDTLVLVTADGGSRAHLSGAGSSLAATLAADEAWARLSGAQKHTGAARDRDRGAQEWHAFLDQVVRAVVGRFRAGAEALVAGLGGRGEEAYSAGQLGSTLTLVAVRRPWVAAAAIGDGFVVTRCGESHYDLLLPPDDAPHTSAPREAPHIPVEPGRTVFVTSPRAAERARRVVARLPDLSGLVVSTDGLRQVGLEHERAASAKPYDRFFGPLFAHADKARPGDAFLARFLAAERLSMLAGDDKTLLVAVERT